MLARELYEQGLSGSEVGLRIGKSKNAVIGYAFRRGWLRRRIKAAPKPKPKRIAPTRYAPKPLKPKSVPLPRMPAINRTGTIMDEGCRLPLWPHGEHAPQPARFCGDPVIAYETRAGVTKKSWCLRCYALCVAVTDPEMPAELRARVDALRRSSVAA